MSQSASTSEGLQFFGRVSASVSHEIKNVFAVINEKAGLLADLTIMAERGMPIDPERLKKTADSIQAQVRRGDTIVKNMNAFAHSTDEETREVDLAEILELTVALATRMADMHQIRLSSAGCEPASLTANPFDLMRLLHSSIAAALSVMEPGGTLAVGAGPGKGGAMFTLASGGKAAPAVDGAPLEAMAQAMGLSAEVGEREGLLELRLAAAPKAG